MFSKAKRFELVVAAKNLNKGPKKLENEKQSAQIKLTPAIPKPKPCPKSTLPKTNTDTHSQCSSTPSVKSFATPKPPKSTIATRAPTSLRKLKNKNEAPTEVIKAQEVEIRNKDHTISEYSKQIEEFKYKISELEKQITDISSNNFSKLDKQLSQLTINDANNEGKETKNNNEDYNVTLLKDKILELENQCEILEQEVTNKQMELKSLEEVITIRDSLCQDLQQKLTYIENDLEETKHRLEMVKGHHALALEANESIRREYRAEIETLKSKLEEEKQGVINHFKTEQDNIKSKYDILIESIKEQMMREKNETVHELQQFITNKDNEMKAKLEQVDEATREKLRLCEIQFEERSRNIQDHYKQQQKTVQYLENEIKDLKYALTLAEEQKCTLKTEIKNIKNENDSLNVEKNNITIERDEIKEQSKIKLIDFENEMNKLTVEVERAVREKHKFETSLSVTRDIVEVLTMRLRESDDELEVLEEKLKTLSNTNEILENELASYKSTLNNTTMECSEYKEALVNILKSKAALAKEHNRIMEHNVSLIESLQNVEKEAYRELGSIKSDLIEDVELLKKESSSQIQHLLEEVENKRVLCELATEHAGQATAAAEQSRVLLAQAAAEINRIETENQRLQQQIHDQQSLVVELSLLRQENEELTMTVAKQSSIIDKMKKDSEQLQYIPKSPTVMRKVNKIGKENLQNVISPLRERNH